MATRLKKKEIAKIYRPNFPMKGRPIAVQLTIHINNLLLTYSDHKKWFTDEFKRCLSNNEQSSNVRINQLIKHYGRPTLKKWFTDVYGWNFNQGESNESVEKEIKSI